MRIEWSCAITAWFGSVWWSAFSAEFPTLADWYYSITAASAAEGACGQLSSSRSVEISLSWECDRFSAKSLQNDSCARVIVVFSKSQSFTLLVSLLHMVRIADMVEQKNTVLQSVTGLLQILTTVHALFATFVGGCVDISSSWFVSIPQNAATLTYLESLSQLIAILQLLCCLQISFLSSPACAWNCLRWCVQKGDRLFSGVDLKLQVEKEPSVLGIFWEYVCFSAQLAILEVLVGWFSFRGGYLFFSLSLFFFLLDFHQHARCSMCSLTPVFGF